MLKSSRFDPVVLSGEDGPSGYFPFQSHLHPADRQTPSEGVCEAVDAYYTAHSFGTRLSQRRQSLSRSVETALAKLYKKADILRQTLLDAGRMEQYRRFGDLIFSNIRDITKGAGSVTLVDFESGADIDIPLDVRLTPAQNAQAYYKKYTKARSAAGMAAGQLEGCLGEISWLEGELFNVSQCTEAVELDEIRAELEREGALRKVSRQQKKVKNPPPTRPRQYSVNGFDILVGKNNVQNETLTFRIAQPDDLWFHVKDAPGSHVILRQGPGGFTDAALEAAGILAAGHSTQHQGAKVAVDYTLRKNVKKIPGARPGMVTYTSYKTMFVTPPGDSVTGTQKE